MNQPIEPIEIPNWKQLLIDLSNSGYSIRRMARIMKIPSTSLQAMKKGHQPRYHIGLAIIKLHEKRHNLFVECNINSPTSRLY